MDPQSPSESADTSSAESKAAKAGQEKAEGKRPANSDTKPSVELITQKAKGLEIDLEKPKKTKIAATSKGKATANSKRSKTESVVKSCYSLRSGPKGMDVDVKATKALAGTKRKGQDIKRNVPGTCKTTGKRRHSDHDDKDGTGAGAAARTTRSRSKKSKVN